MGLQCSISKSSEPLQLLRSPWTNDVKSELVIFVYDYELVNIINELKMLDMKHHREEKDESRSDFDFSIFHQKSFVVCTYYCCSYLIPVSVMNSFKQTVNILDAC